MKRHHKVQVYFTISFLVISTCNFIIHYTYGPFGRGATYLLFLSSLQSCLLFSPLASLLKNRKTLKPLLFFGIILQLLSLMMTEIVSWAFTPDAQHFYYIAAPQIIVGTLVYFFTPKQSRRS